MPDGRVETTLFPACTVRIEVAGSPKGTGFFIVPGVVVTCAHVIESQQLTPGDADPGIEVVTLAGVRHHVQVKQVWPKEGADLAILQLPAATDDPCVLVAAGLEARDPLHSFGYHDGHPEGVPTTLEAEGPTGDEKLIKFKEGQVRPGMSGSPVLNMRTGAVCAMVKRSIDPTQDLGGFGIPIAMLLQLDATLQSGNQRYHETNRRWLDLLPTQQRNVLRSLGAGRSALTGRSITFVVSIGQSGDDWGVTAELDGDPVAAEAVRVDFYTVREKVARLFRDWASRGRVDSATQIRLLGEILYRAAFPGAIGARFEQLLGQRKENPLLVALHFQAGTHPELVSLPWEYLYFPLAEATGIYLSADPYVSFVRCHARLPSGNEPVERREVSALVVGLAPRAQDGEVGVFDAAQIDKVVFEVAHKTGDVQGLVIERVETEDAAARDPLAFAEKLAGDYQVIHLVAFGRFSHSGDELVASIAFDAFVNALQEASPTLVVLQLLEAEKQLVAADFALLAPRLVTQSIPAVLAYQYPVKADPAIRFDVALYTQLAAGYTVDVAVQKARNSAFTLEPAERAFVAPALFVCSPGGIRLAAPPSAGARQQRIGALAS